MLLRLKVNNILPAVNKNLRKKDKWNKIKNKEVRYICILNKTNKRIKKVKTKLQV